jgi:hypothetical protein
MASSVVEPDGGGEVRWIPVLAVVGCVGSFCERQASSGEGCGLVDDTEIAECEEALALCDAVDQVLLGDYMACLREAGANTCGSTPGDDVFAEVECSRGAADLTEPCRASFAAYAAAQAEAG